MSILELKNISYTYGIGTPFEKKAVNDVSFSVNKGELIGIIGHTGSGKSTLVQMLNGLIKPTEGQVLFDGKDIWAKPKEIRKIRFKVGMVFQYPEYQLFEETVYKDIAFGPANKGKTGAELDLAVKKAAEFTGLKKELLQKSPFDLSGGEKRRAAIAGVIAMEPEILILDEPAAGLDPESRKEILENVQAYRKAKNATVIMVSHSMADVAQMTDRLLVLNGARLAMDGTPREIFSRAQELVDMGLDIPQITAVFLRLREMGLDVPEAYTLEQAVQVLKQYTGGADNA